MVLGSWFWVLRSGSRFSLWWALLAGAAVIAACTSQPPASDAGSQLTPEWFTDRAHEAGLDFVHFNGMSGKFYQPEIMAPGVALFDYDNDGDLDAYLVQGQMLGTGTALFPPPPGRLEDRLYRNDLVVNPDGTRTLRFTDVTAASGIDPRGYGMGVAAGDIENDGWVDLYLSGFGRNQMFHNNGNGTFTDISKSSGTDDADSWGVPATFFDFDRDGLVDLFVGDYLNYTLKNDVPCFSDAGKADYCRPHVYRPQPNHLYRNLGGRKFSDVTIAAGLGRPFGGALGAVAADFNGDGWPDLFVANDEQENQLWINQRNGTFIDTAVPAGVALGPNGERKANMGVDAGDFDNDGDNDLFVTELINQGSSLYVNSGPGEFEEQSARLGVRRPSLPFTGFGTAWLDYDNDGLLDLFSVNGDVNRNGSPGNDPTDPFPLKQRKLLLRNAGGRFEEVTAGAGRALQAVEASRGAAFGDVDNDGDIDVLVGNGAGPTRLLINNLGSRNHWLGLKLVTTSRSQVGARVAVMRSNGPTMWRHAHADGSYGSANDPRVLVGLGPSSEKPRLQVTWPDGRTEEWPAVDIDRYVTVTEGTAK